MQDTRTVGYNVSTHSEETQAMPLDADQDTIIRGLKQDLRGLRHGLVQLLPHGFARLLGSYQDCLSSKESHQWMDHVARSVVARAEPLRHAVSGWDGQANCPLCGRGANAPYQEGFALPEGLRRHLVGSGDTPQCFFTEAAEHLARDHWREKFADGEQLDGDADQRVFVGSQNKETVYQLDPFDPGHLLDEKSWPSGRCRNAEELGWAESRLQSLGLEKRVSGNVSSWVEDRETCVVYADVRSVGRIHFSVWKKPLPKRPPSNAQRFRICQFYLRDSWKNELRSMYEARLPRDE
jgi:hypothetical protein